MSDTKRRAGRSVVIVGLRANTSVARHLRDDLGYVRTDSEFVRFYVPRNPYGSRAYFIGLGKGEAVRELSEVVSEIESATIPVLAVVILDAHRFESSGLIRFCTKLNRQGIDVVLSGNPEQDFFEVAACADIPVINQDSPCLHALESGSCGRPGKSWVWYNKTGYFPAVEFLKEILQVLLWFLKLFSANPALLLKASVRLERMDQHYPNIPDLVASFAPWFIVRGLFGNGLHQEARCRLHAGKDRYDRDGAGNFTFVVGSCEAGKSTALALEIEKMELRYGSENVMSCAALPRGSRSRVPGRYRPEHARTVQRVLELSQDRIFCFIDEAELYGVDLVTATRDLILQGKFVQAASYQVRGDLRPFANTAGLMALADKVIYLPAVCEVCGLPAHKTQVLVRRKGKEGAWHALSALDFEAGDWIPDDVFRENEVSFRPRCLGCHELPDEDKRDESSRLLDQVWGTADSAKPSDTERTAEAREREKRRISLNNGYRLLAVLLLANAVMGWFLLPAIVVVAIPLVFYWFWRKFAPPIGVRFRMVAAALETILVLTIGVTIAIVTQVWLNTPLAVQQELLGELLANLRYYVAIAQIEIWRESELSKLFLTYEYYWDLLTLPIPLIVSISTAIFLGIKLIRFAKRLRRKRKKAT